MFNKKLLGLKSKVKGRAAERYFSDLCAMQGVRQYRIEDGGFPIIRAGRQSFVRTKQLCDFILFINNQAFLIDIKCYEKKFLIPSRFYSYYIKKPTSTHKQTMRFMDIACAGFPRTGFMVFDPELNNQSFDFISGPALSKFFTGPRGDKNFKKYFTRCDKIRDIIAVCQ